MDNTAKINITKKLKIRMHGILNSTMVSAIGYDLVTKTLRVKFKKNKKIYDYRRVPPEKFAQLMSSGSMGLAMHAQILRDYNFVELKDMTVKEIVDAMKEKENVQVITN